MSKWLEKEDETFSCGRERGLKRSPLVNVSSHNPHETESAALHFPPEQS